MNPDCDLLIVSKPYINLAYVNGTHLYLFLFDCNRMLIIQPDYTDSHNPNLYRQPSACGHTDDYITISHNDLLYRYHMHMTTYYMKLG